MDPELIAAAQAELERRQLVEAAQAELASRQQQAQPTHQPQPQPESGGAIQKLRAFTQGYLGNLGDEAVAATDAIFLHGQDPFFHDSPAYKERLAWEREQSKAFNKDHPWQSAAMQVVGGASNPIFWGAGQIAKGAGLLKGTAQAAGVGGAYGAAYGFGGGEGVEDRLAEAKQGGVVGATTGGLLNLGARAAGAIAKSESAKQIADKLLYPTKNQKGAILPKTARLPELSRSEHLLAQELNRTGVPAKTLRNAANDVQRATRTNKGSFYNIVDAADDPGLNTIAQYLRSNPDSGRVVGKYVQTRARGQSDRLTKAIGFSGQSTDDALLGVKDAAQRRIGEAVEARSAISDPLYRKALEETKILSSPKLSEWAENSVFKSVIKEVRKLPKYADEGLYPDTSAEILDQAKQVLNERLSGSVKPYASKAMKQLRSDIIEALEKGTPELRHAANTYQKLSKPINVMEGTKNAPVKGNAKGLFTDILAVDSTEPIKIGNAIMGPGKSAQQIKKMRTALGKGEQEAWDNGIKAFLVNKAQKVSESNEGMGAFLRWYDTPEVKAKLNAAIGDKDFLASFGQELARENRMALTNQLTGGRKFANSATASMLNMRQRVAKAWDTVQKIRRGDVAGLAEDAITASLSPQHAEVQKEMAKILFSPKQGAQSARKIAAYLESLQAHQAAVNETTRAAATGGSKLAAALQGRD